MQSRLALPRFHGGAFLAVSLLTGLHPQTSGATFGTVVQLGGTPSDVVLDESRSRLYLVNSAANRVDVYSYSANQVLGSIFVGQTPRAAAMSMDNSHLYVTNNASSTLSVIDLSIGIGSVSQTVTLPAKPEGVAVGDDGRAVITTEGSGTGSAQNTLLIFDPSQQSSQQLIPVAFPPPAPTPVTLPTVLARPTTTFYGKLIRTPDGTQIVGVSTTNNNTQSVVFVYEVDSGVVLNSRIVTGQSTTLAMAPDGSRFMAGFTLYDTATLNVLAQQNTANAPFTLTGSFNTSQNVGGSSFSPDGGVLYSAFNVAPTTTPPSAPQASTLLISDSQSLAIQLGINLPESIVAKIVVTSDGANAWGLSDSGLIYLPLSTLFNYPILMPQTNTVFLSESDCNPGLATGSLQINNVGGGTLTFSVPAAISGGSAALIVRATSGLAPATVTLTMDPGRAGETRYAGTNLYSGGGTSNTGFAVNISLASPNAVNIPNVIRVYMNYRLSDQRGIVYPIPTVPNSNTEGLQDIVLDPVRNRIYISNSGFNRVEIFDIASQQFLSPIPVGQLPHEIAMGLDGSTLYVANTGGENISMVDLDLGQVVGRVPFPPIPRAGNTNPIHPQNIAMGLLGLQVIMSDGTQWHVINNQALPRPVSNVISPGANAQTAVSQPSQLLASPDNLEMILMGNTGIGYLYNSLADSFTSSRQLFTAPIISFYGVLGAGPAASYLLANGLILNSSLAVIGGAQTPGTVTTTPPAPGQFPSVTVVSAGQRNVAAVAPVDDHTFVRMTTAVRQSLTTNTSDDPRTTLQLVDLSTGSISLVGPMPENPVFEVYGSARQAVPPRQMVVDPQGTVYAITISGLSVIPTTQATSATQPQIAGDGTGIQNATDGTSTYAPGAFININGTALAATATANQLPAPSVLGGSCVVVDNVPLPLLQTSPAQISAQLPASIRPGINVIQVRSLAMAQDSQPMIITVAKPQ